MHAYYTFRSPSIGSATVAASAGASCASLLASSVAARSKPTSTRRSRTSCCCSTARDRWRRWPTAPIPTRTRPRSARSERPRLPNRWGTAVQALTGEISGPAQHEIQLRHAGTNGRDVHERVRNPRREAVRLRLLLGLSPPRVGHVRRHTRKLPGLSTGLGGAGGDATDFSPTTSITTRDYNTGAAGCTFTQLTDGALDNARDILRFGLMTFDSDPDTGTGVTGSSPIAVNTAAPFAGMWSYFTGGTPAERARSPDIRSTARRARSSRSVREIRRRLRGKVD